MKIEIIKKATLYCRSFVINYL